MKEGGKLRQLQLMPATTIATHIVRLDVGIGRQTSTNSLEASEWGRKEDTRQTEDVTRGSHSRSISTADHSQSPRDVTDRHLVRQLLHS
jgi:hypothetical protein